jgi:hypothetical protein
MWVDAEYTNPRPEKAVTGNEMETQLFMVRLWHVEVVPYVQATNGGAINEVADKWHGKVEQIIKGEARTFTDWDAMIRFLDDMMLRRPAGPIQEWRMYFDSQRQVADIV